MSAFSVSSTLRQATGPLFRTRLVLVLCAIPAFSVALFGIGPTRGQSPTPPPDPWPGFRGPTVTGTAAADAFPDSGDFGLEIAWKRPIGSGYSGISIGADIVVTMFADDDQDVIAAFDPRTGEQRWKAPIGPNYRGHDGSYDGPTSTPLIDRGRVFALSAWGRLMAFDAADGEQIWSVELTEEHAAHQPTYSFATSPLIEADTLIVQIGAPGAAVAGFDPDTGEIRWTAGTDAINYQSPVPMTIGSDRQVVATGLTRLFGLDPETGEELWSIDHGGDGFLGAESLVPVPMGEDRVFLALKDQSSSAIALDPGNPEGNGRQLWESRAIRNSYSVPVYHEGFIYGFSSRFLTAVDATTGEAAWKSRPPGDGFPVIADSRLIVLTKDGTLHVAEASPEGYRELAGIDVFADMTWSPPSIGLGSIFVRSIGEIARIDIRRAPRVTDTVVATAGDAPAGSEFAAFLSDLQQTADKASAIDRFLAAQETFPIIEGRDLVHFVYRGEADDLALAGDVIGARQEGRMHRAPDTDLFYFSVGLEPDARVNYRFIRDYQEIRDPRNSRTTVSEVYGPEMEIMSDGSVSDMSWLAMPDWEPAAHLEPPSADTPRGRVVEHTIATEIFGPTLPIRVYLPPGYDESDQRYPVAYYHGGFQVLAHGEIPASLDNLIAAGQPPVIAVFIFAAPNIELVVPGVGNADLYARMWAEELVPYVDETFRTVAAPEGRANIGAGWFSYPALYTAFRQPGIAGKLAVQTVVMNDSRRMPLEDLVTNSDQQPLDIYIEWGSHDAQNPQENWDARFRSRGFFEFLRERGYAVEGGEVHDGTGWASYKNRTDRVFRALFPRE